MCRSEARNEGTVVSVTDGIIRIHGLAEVMYGEMIEFEGGIYGMALNLERDSVGAVILGDYKSAGGRSKLPLYWPYSGGPRGPRAAGSRR